MSREEAERLFSETLKNHSSNMPWLKDSLSLVTIEGSRAYGLDTPESDYDFRGFCIPPKQYFFGFSKGFDQAESRSPADSVVYEIRKFFKLATDCNPNIISILYTEPEDIAVLSPIGEKVLANRDLFLSKKSRYTFAGYSIAQLNRIKLHRKWLLNPVENPPTRAEFGLPEKLPIPDHHVDECLAEIRNRTDGWEPDLSACESKATIQYLKEKVSDLLLDLVGSKDQQFVVAAKTLALPDSVIEIITKEKKFRQAQANWKSYQDWKKNRNPKRAEMESKYGFDAKHAVALIRLGVMAKEILTTGKVIVKRPDREFFMNIRNGGWTYEQVEEWANNLDSELDELYKNSTLPNAPDRNAIDKLCIELVEESLSKGNNV